MLLKLLFLIAEEIGNAEGRFLLLNIYIKTYTGAPCSTTETAITHIVVNFESL